MMEENNRDWIGYFFGRRPPTNNVSSCSLPTTNTLAAAPFFSFSGGEGEEGAVGGRTL